MSTFLGDTPQARQTAQDARGRLERSIEAEGYNEKWYEGQSTGTTERGCSFALYLTQPEPPPPTPPRVSPPLPPRAAAGTARGRMWW